MTVRYILAKKHVTDGIAAARKQKRGVKKRLAAIDQQRKRVASENAALDDFLEWSEQLPRLGPMFGGLQTGYYLASSLTLDFRTRDESDCPEAFIWNCFHDVIEFAAKDAHVEKQRPLQDAESSCPKCSMPSVTMVCIEDSSSQAEGTHLNLEFRSVCFHCLRATVIGRGGYGRRYRFPAVPSKVRTKARKK